MPSTQQALVALYLLADERRLRLQKGHTCTPDWFRTQGVVVGLATPSRKAAIRLVRRETCLGCGEALPVDSTGDHIVPLAAGGVEGLENYVPLCKRCNSSKGKRDFLEWWPRRASEIPPDVLVVYCRMAWRDHLRRRAHNAEAPEALATIVGSFMEELPTEEHRRALRRRVAWVTGKPWC